jgi:hypothetical protein
MIDDKTLADIEKRQRNASQGYDSQPIHVYAKDVKALLDERKELLAKVKALGGDHRPPTMDDFNGVVVPPFSQVVAETSSPQEGRVTTINLGESGVRVAGALDPCQEDARRQHEKEMGDAE